jgi:hypothetical protein
VHEQMDDRGDEEAEDGGDGEKQGGADEDGSDATSFWLRRGDAEGHDEGVGDRLKEFHG